LRGTFYKFGHLMLPISSIIDAHLDAVRDLQLQEESIARLGMAIIDHLRQGQRIFLCGNGGSAADAQHIAAELVCRFEAARRGLPAIALTTDTSALTAISNDFGFERVFARQVEALGQTGDVLIALSTSGNSANVVAAVQAARGLGIASIGLLGGDGGRLRDLVDQALVVPSPVTARIQECHILVGHIWCAMVDAAFSAS
jgi:phosphoheptose isomerase